jgi:hypothetical protein
LKELENSWPRGEDGMISGGYALEGVLRALRRKGIEGVSQEDVSKLLDSEIKERREEASGGLVHKWDNAVDGLTEVASRYAAEGGPENGYRAVIIICPRAVIIIGPRLRENRPQPFRSQSPIGRPLLIPMMSRRECRSI